MTKKMTLENTFTVAELNKVIDSIREELKEEIKEIESEDININDIEELSDRLKVLTVAHNISDLFDELVKKLAHGL